MPPIDEFTKGKRPEVRAEFVLHSAGAEKLNKDRQKYGDKPNFSEGDVLYYPGYGSLDVRFPWYGSSYWMQRKEAPEAGLQVPRGEDLFSEMIIPGKERR